MSKTLKDVAVIDVGSWTIKAGFAGDDEPRGAIPTLVGTDAKKGDAKVGLALQAYYNKLDAQFPLEDGIVTNWEDMEKLWSHVFSDVLAAKSSDCSVLLTDSSTGPDSNKAAKSTSNREKMAQLMFEKFDVPKLYIANQSVLGLYSTGRFTGLIVSAGHASTHVVPIYEGYSVSENIETIPIAGKAVSEYLVKSMQDKGTKFPSKSFPVFEAAKIKESMCKVAENFDDEVKQVTDKDYTLPDGTKISVGKEASEAAELLFKPQLADPKSEHQPLHKVIQSTIGKCEMDARSGLMSAITLIGGTSMMSGFTDRVTNETKALLGAKVKVISHAQRAISTWIGGSVLAALPQTDWVTKAEFQDKGCSAIRQCP